MGHALKSVKLDGYLEGDVSSQAACCNASFRTSGVSAAGNGVCENPAMRAHVLASRSTDAARRALNFAICGLTSQCVPLANEKHTGCVNLPISGHFAGALCVEQVSKGKTLRAAVGAEKVAGGFSCYGGLPRNLSTREDGIYGSRTFSAVEIVAKRLFKRD
jgi:hypothetical protein